MDVPRLNPKRKLAKWLGWSLLVLGLVAISAVGFAGGDRPAKTVKRESVYTAAVERGPMLREVHGRGTLVPRRIRWLTAETAGRVEEIRIQPGHEVDADTLVVVLSNADVELAALEAQSQLAEAEALLVEVQATLDTERLERKSQVASLKAQFSEAERRAKANDALASQGAVTGDDLSASKEKVEETKSRLGLGKEQLHVSTRAGKSRIEAQRAAVKRLAAVVDFRTQQVERMQVRAGDSGVLQEMPLEIGQWVTPGTVLAKVVRPHELNAELRIPEVQAKDVRVGQTAVIDTRSGMVPGHVVRIDPAVTDGTVSVEIEFDEALPEDVRPDLSIEGRIELERLDDVLQVARPVGVHPNTGVLSYRLDPGGESAEATPVRFGRSSVDTIEIVSGLSVGDEIIVSDTSALGDAARLVFH